MSSQYAEKIYSTVSLSLPLSLLHLHLHLGHLADAFIQTSLCHSLTRPSLPFLSASLLLHPSLTRSLPLSFSLSAYLSGSPCCCFEDNDDNNGCNYTDGNDNDDDDDDERL